MKKKSSINSLKATLLFCLSLALQGYGQCNKYFDRNSAYLYISRQTPIDGEFTVTQNGIRHAIKNSCLGQFVILTAKHFYAYDQCTNRDLIIHFDSGRLKATSLNTDSFIRQEGQAKGLNIDRLSRKFIHGNDSICLLYFAGKKPGSEKHHLVYSFNLKKGRIERLLYTATLATFSLGNDPLSNDFKLGAIVRENNAAASRLIIIDLQTQQVITEISHAEQFAFAPDTNIVMVSVFSRSIELYKTNGDLLYKLDQVGNYTIDEINWLQSGTLYIKIKKPRFAGERYKMRDLKWLYPNLTYKKRRIRYGGIVNL